MEQQQGVRQGRRRAKKDPPQGTSEGKSLSKKRWRTLLTDNYWSRWLKLLLLLCFIDSIGSSTEHVTGTKGGSVTLSCELQDHEISVLVLNRLSKNILVCQNDECKSVDDTKVFKKGSCDIMLKNLSFSDAGKYILRVYPKNNQTEVEQQEMEYNLHIHDEISVKTGEQLKMDVLMIDAYKVEHQNINSTEWTEVWTRSEEVQSDQTLTISNFTVTDTGTYRVLDFEGEIWITVTVTGSSSGSKGKLDTDEDKPDDNKERTVESWIIVLSVIGPLLLVLVISAVIWKYKCRSRNTEQGHYQRGETQDTEMQSRTSRDDTGNL